MINVTDFTVDGKCSSCGACCSNLLPLSDKEVSDIKKYIKKHHIKQQRHNAAMYDMTCPFRDEVNKKCLIYPIRPAICRQFMCNHTLKDIENAKLNFHAINRVVLMRNEFFGSNEEFDFMLAALKSRRNK